MPMSNNAVFRRKCFQFYFIMVNGIQSSFPGNGELPCIISDNCLDALKVDFNVMDQFRQLLGFSLFQDDDNFPE
jgi:hypothetical protein